VIVWGESDKLIPPIYGPAFQSAIAGSTLVNVPEAGHMVIAEKPAAVVKAVEAVA
jgi:pimeloyl-ACP methyl ester carboxylesterase